MNFNALLQASLKSKDTEEWLDVYFTRPAGLAFALFFKAVKIHPNTVTVISIILGAASGFMFYHTDTTHNVIGIILLTVANFLDSADGQLARLTNQKTLLGRLLDGFAGDVWFFMIYAALCLRMMPEQIPGTDVQWGMWIWLLAFISGIMSHSPQSSLADYYRQIHLFFLKGKDGSELDSYRDQRADLKSLSWKKDLFACLYHYNYANYCKSQERRSPAFQKMTRHLTRCYGSPAALPRTLREKFLDGSRPLMKYTNILTFNTRAICLYATCLLDCPWVYLLFEITVLNIIYVYMHKRHESLCTEITKRACIQKEITQQVAAEHEQ